MCTMNQIKASVKISEPFLNCVTDLDLTVSDSMSLEIFVEFEHFVLCVFSFICFLEKSIFKDLHHYRVLCLFEVSVFMFALLLREVSQYIYEKPRYQMFYTQENLTYSINVACIFASLVSGDTLVAWQTWLRDSTFK